MTSNTAFRDDIQGLRALAVILVVVYHSGMDILNGGYIGVDVFFVISGFLIAGTLIRELETSGTLALGKFYARRARRLLPAAVFVFIVTIVVWRLIYSPLELKQFSSSAIATAAYLSNFWFAHLATDYLADHSNPNPLLHTWSLSVEEQFYIFWPFILLTLYKFSPAGKKAGAMIFGTIGISLVSLGGCIYLTSYAQPWAFFICFTRFWEFGLGALCAVYLQKRGQVKPGFANFGAYLGLSLVILCAVIFTAQTTFPGFLALIPVLGTSLLLLCVSEQRTNILYAMLAHPFCKFIGDISYSLYLWHWPVFVFLEEYQLLHETVWQFSGIAVSIGLATLTYYLIENPIRFSPAITLKTSRSYFLAFFLTILSITAGFAVREEAKSGLDIPSQKRLLEVKSTRPKIYSDNCHYQQLDVDLNDCVYGNPEGDRTIVLFGDSHAAHWFPALETISAESNWRLVPYTKSSCPSVVFEPYNPYFGRTYRECTEWRSKVIAELKRHPPDFIFISNSYGYQRTDGIQGLDWRIFLQRLLADLGMKNTKIIIIQDVPFLPFDAPTCLARAQWQNKRLEDACRYDREKAISPDFLAAEQEVSNDYDNVTFLNLNEIICPEEHCRVLRDELVLYSDSNHISVSFSRDLAEEFKRFLD